MHAHLLPQIDDGSNSVEISKRMIAELHRQGVTKIYATPHFYAHSEKSVDDFLQKRQTAWEKLDDESILLGAEVAIEHDISRLPEIEKLTYQHTDLILLEFPYRKFENWMEDEINHIAHKFNLTPVIAHISRYIDIFTSEQMERVLSMPVIFQVNNEAFAEYRQAKFVRQLMKDKFTLIFSSDCHSDKYRRPNWDLLKKKCQPEIIEQSMRTIESHFIKL